MNVPVIFTQDAPTKLQGRSMVLQPNEVRKFSGGPVGRHRKSIRITNEDNTVKAYVGVGDPETGSPDQKAVPIFPNQSVELFTSDDLIISNPNPGQTPINVLEIFYTGAGSLIAL